jgi:hypothetical protein
MNVQTQIGDYKTRFYDGSLGGFAGTIFGYGDPVPGNSTSFDIGTRKLAGRNQGYADAADIINSLQKDPEGNITESIKYVTSSMGTAYQRGFSEGVNDYIVEQNTIIDQYNAALPKNADGSYLDPSQAKKHLVVNQEFTVDLDPYQGNELNADPNVKNNYYMLNDGVESNFIGNPINNSSQIGLDKNGKTTMHGHHPSWAQENAFPKSNQNAPKDKKSKIENPSD